MKKYTLHNISLGSLLTILLSCTAPEQTPSVQPETPAQRTVTLPTDPAGAPATPTSTPVLDRDEWQRPEVIIGMNSSDLTGTVFGDLFAGDGYFTWKLIDAGANVIAVVNDPKDLAALNAEKAKRGLSDERLKVRAVPIGDPGLQPNEVDIALLVHKYFGIQDKPAYFEQLRKGIRYPRYMMIVDWQYRETPIGPPLSQRTETNTLMEAILSYEWAEVGAHSDKIPYQVIFFASDPMDEM